MFLKKIPSIRDKREGEYAYVQVFREIPLLTFSVWLVDIREVFKKRLVQITIVSVMWLLRFLSGKFWQHTAVSCIPLHAVFVELQPQKWAGVTCSSDPTMKQLEEQTCVCEILLQTCQNINGNILIAEASLWGGMHELYAMLRVV